MQKLFEHKFVYHLLFLIVFGYFFLDLRLDHTITQPPHGVHQWRQSDGASMARVFEQKHNSIFEPQIFNQFGDDGSAGGEFPLFYYIAGKTYNIFNYHPFILRFILFLPFFIGLLAMLDALLGLFNYKLFALLPMFIFLCSPTFMNYSVSTLPDAAGFGLALIGSSFLLKFQKSKSKLHLVLSSLTFMIAGLTKISMLLPMFALVGAYGVSSIIHKTRWAQVAKSIAYVIITMMPVLSWYRYISNYNLLHKTTYFATSIRPIWDLSSEEIHRIWLHINNFWLQLIFTDWYANAVIGALLICALAFRKIDRFIILISLLLLIGSLAYGLLFYINLEHHDYYFLPFFFLFLMIFIWAAKSIELSFQSKWIRLGSIVLLAVISWQTAQAAVKKTRKSYQGWFNDFSLSKSLFDVESFLDNKNIPKSAKFAVPQDESSNISLLFLNRSGYTKLSGIFDVDDLDPLIDQGVEYALVLDTSFYSVTFLKYHITDTIGYHHELGIYKVGHSKWWNPEAEGLSE